MIAEGTAWRASEVQVDPESVSTDAPAASPTDDMVYRPSLYTRFKIEPITFIMENGIGFATGNVIKYVCRHDAKNGIEDLKKARRYLDMMINQAEGQEVL